MTMDEMIELFSADGLQKKAAVFDTKKLEWMNGQHLSRTPAAELEPIVTPAIVEAGFSTASSLAERQDWYLTLLDLLKVRARTIGDIVRQAEPYLRDTITYDAEAAAKQWKDVAASAEILAAVRDELSKLESWTPEAMEPALRSLAEARGLGGGKVFQPLRLALTGLPVSPQIFDVLTLLGRDRSLSRIESAIRYVGNSAGG
jgi:glutamyl-tRNA synthetase